MKKLSNILMALLVSFGIMIVFSLLIIISFFNYGFLENLFEPVYSLLFLLVMLDIHPAIVLNIYIIIFWSALFGIVLGIISIFRDERKLVRVIPS